MAGLIKSKLTKSQHIDKCKPSNPLNKKWGDKNPAQSTQLNKKMKIIIIIARRQVKGGGGKDFARDLTELMTRERRKNYWENTSIYLLNPDTAL